VGNTVTLTFAGDSKSLERTFDKVGAGAKDMAKDMDKAGADVKQFGSRMDDMNTRVGESEGKFMGAADLLDGLGGAFGLPLEGATNMARSFADLASGLSSVAGPAITKILGLLGFQTAATTAQAAATGAATTTQWSLNAALAANPIGVVVIAITALVGAFILAWKHSETFRDIVRGALDVVKNAAMSLWNFFKELPGNLMAIGQRIADAIIWPYKTAFNAIARLWNSTVGQLSFSIPSWVPGMGGKGFAMPQLPTFHQGGTVPGNPGQAVPILAMAGETVSPAGGTGGGTLVVKVVLDGRDIHQSLLRLQRTSGNLGIVGA
jgi:phage-related protein